MTPVVIDASAGAEIVTDTRRGNALLRLLPQDADPWVPEHFFAEGGDPAQDNRGSRLGRDTRKGSGGEVGCLAAPPCFHPPASRSCMVLPAQHDRN
jgi:hypothetical protein